MHMPVSTCLLAPANHLYVANNAYKSHTIIKAIIIQWGKAMISFILF